MSPADLEARRAAIRLPKSTIAQAAGIHKQTVYEILKAGVHEPLASTFNKIEREIRRDELRLRDYLLALHPVERPSITVRPPTVETIERLRDGGSA